MPADVAVYLPGPWDIYDSYGLIGCQLARHLDALGARVACAGPGDRNVESQPPDVRRIVRRDAWAGPGGILCGYPTTYEHYGFAAQHGPRIAVTMFESSRIPPGWAEALNECDAVVVPSQFCRDVFTRCGVTTPVHVVPLGVSETYQPALRPSNRKPYTFLAWGDRGKRKGHFEALQAFYRAFGDSMDYRLVIKARDIEAHVICTNPNVEVLRVDMTEAELYQLFLDSDCMVFPTRGEGFGLPPREFAASGGPVIATAWSGTVDDIETWGIPLSFTLEPADWRGARNLQGMDLGVWARPDVEDLAYLMRVVAGNRESFAREAFAAAHDVHRLYSWRHFAEGVLNVWREVAGAPAYA